MGPDRLLPDLPEREIGNVVNAALFVLAAVEHLHKVPFLKPFKNLLFGSGQHPADFGWRPLFEPDGKELPYDVLFPLRKRPCALLLPGRLLDKALGSDQIRPFFQAEKLKAARVRNLFRKLALQENPVLCPCNPDFQKITL